MKTILSCENINKQIYVANNPKSILKDVSLSIEEGEFVSIMGASGAGKSTLLYILGLMDKSNTGDIYINGEKVSGKSENELCKVRRDILGFVFQTYNLIPSLTAIDNILLPAYMKQNSKLKEEKYETARALLEEVGLKDKENQMITDLSGGEQQRIAIARALINNPKVILMDEPTGNLDSKNGKVVMDLVRKINEKHRVTFLQVTHSLDYANYGNRILHMRDGEICNETDIR